MVLGIKCWDCGRPSMIVRENCIFCGAELGRVA
jgi:uncharacterized OB-fold protein